jgi:CBS domain-containing protein
MIESRTATFGSKKVTSVAGKSQRSLWYPVSSTGTMYDVAEHFKLGVHRVPIINYTGGLDRLVGIITQSDGAQFLYEKRYDLDVDDTC